MAGGNAQAVGVPSPSALARRYMRTHHSRIDAVRKKPAISHQPPSCSGGRRSPYFAAGGSSASHGNCRTNWIGSHPTEAHMFRPMISMAMKPQSSDANPVKPR